MPSLGIVDRNSMPSGSKSVRVGREVYLVPDRAAVRWTARPERVLVNYDGEVHIYEEAGEIRLDLETRQRLAAQWSSEPPRGEIFSSSVIKLGDTP